MTLLGTAFIIGLLHTVMGPDHYLPFIVLNKAEGWTLRKTLVWTAICGLAHVLSSVAIGSIGIALGWTLGSMEGIESSRGDIASYVLIGAGVVYFAWGMWRARGHKHEHVHVDGSVHSHGHKHDADTSHDGHMKSHRRTAWVLFLIFVLGPCEPLIPLLLVPASQHSPWLVAAVAGAYGLATLAMMLLIVTAGVLGLRFVRLGAAERYAHAMAGFVLVLSGVLIVLGL